MRQHEARASELARRADAGEVITITDRECPIAELGPHRAGFRFARKDDVVRAFATLPSVDPDRLRDDLDALVDPTSCDPDER